MDSVADDPAEERRSPETMGAYVAWADLLDDERVIDFHGYMQRVAEARFVMRHVLRITGEQARKHGLESLLHQALIQICSASPADGISISALAQRLDVAVAYASRMVKELESMGLVQRARSPHDKRITRVLITADGVNKLRSVDDSVHMHMALFQREYAVKEKFLALSIFAFYVGLDPASATARGIRACE